MAQATLNPVAPLSDRLKRFMQQKELDPTAIPTEAAGNSIQSVQDASAALGMNSDAGEPIQMVGDAPQKTGAITLKSGTPIPVPTPTNVPEGPSADDAAAAANMTPDQVNAALSRLSSEQVGLPQLTKPSDETKPVPPQQTAQEKKRSPGVDLSGVSREDRIAQGWEEIAPGKWARPKKMQQPLQSTPTSGPIPVGNGMTFVPRGSAAKGNEQRTIDGTTYTKMGNQWVDKDGNAFMPNNAKKTATELKEETAAEKEAKQKELTSQGAETGIRDINQVFKFIKDVPERGNLGTMMQMGKAKILPKSAEANLQGSLDAVKTRIGFDALAAMRAASPTGGALGQVSDFENKMLQSMAGRLDPWGDRAQFVSNMKDLAHKYVDTVHGSDSQLDDAVKHGVITKQQADKAKSTKASILSGLATE